MPGEVGPLLCCASNCICLDDTPGLAEIWAIYIGRRAAAGPALGRNRRVRIGEAWAGHAFGLAGEVILIDLG